MDPQKPPAPQEPVMPNPVNPEVPSAPPTDQPPTAFSPLPVQSDGSAMDVPAPPQPAVFTPTPPKKKKNWLKALVIGAAAVLVVGGSAAAAYLGYYLPNQPDNILKMALVNTFSSDAPKTAYVDGKFTIKDDAADMTLDGTIEGKSDDQGNLDVTVKVDALVTTVTVDIRSVDGNFYFRVSGLQGLPELLGVGEDPNVQAYASLIDTLENQWIEVNKSLIEEFSGIEDGFNLSQADLDKLADIYRKHSFLKVKQTFPDEKVKDMQSYHYQVVLDKTELLAAFQELKNANVKGLKVTQEEVDGLKESLKSVDFGKYPVDLWIDKDSKVINQIGFKVKDSEGSGDFRISFFDFNKPVKVEKPEGAKSVLEVLGPVLGGLMQGSFEDPAIMQQLEAQGISL